MFLWSLESIPRIDPAYEAEEKQDLAGDNDDVWNGHDSPPYSGGRLDRVWLDGRASGLSYRRNGDLMTTGSTGALSSALICFARRLRMSLV